MWHDVKNIFHFLIIFQCFFFSAYLLSQRNKRRLSNIILAGFLLTKAVTEIGGVFYHFEELKKIIFDAAPYLLYYPSTFQFVYVPLLFLYILSFTKKDFAYKKIYWCHFIPFILLFVFFIVQFNPGTTELIRVRLQSGFRFTLLEDRLLSLAEYVQFFAYAAASLFVLKKYRQRIKEMYSSIENINLSWLNFVIYGFISWKSLRLIDEILWVATGESYVIMYVMYIFAEIAFLTFVCFMFLKGLKQPVIFIGVDENQLRIKYEKTLLSEKVKNQYQEKLLEYMETQKPHLDCLLSLNDLAEKVDIPAHHLSQVINSCFNQNFYDFINSYRIKESQRLLLDRPEEQKTILEILYETGFNSKSAFNLAFKKFTGMTPSQFRRAQDS